MGASGTIPQQTTGAADLTGPPPDREVPVRSASLQSTTAALNPLHLARKIVPSRNTPIEHLAFYATIAVLALAEIIEPPIAALIVVGHRLHSSHNELLREIGSGFDQVA